MSLLRLELEDDLDELVRQWMECGDEAKKLEIAESHYLHRSKLGSSDRKLEQKYMSLCTMLWKAEQGRHRGRSYSDIYWKVKGQEDGKKIGKFLKVLAIIICIGVVISVVVSIANAPRTPEHILRQRHPYDPVDDPRSDSGGYRTRGL
jgi:hypothetical protein